jgi:uncharacterized protein YndB with AHSA1/START domain
MSAVLRLERTFDAPASKVYEAWTSAEVLRRWWHAEHDWETPIAEVDVRVGGAIRLVMRNPADGSEYAGSGVYTLLERRTGSPSPGSGGTSHRQASWSRSS